MIWSSLPSILSEILSISLIRSHGNWSLFLVPILKEVKKLPSERIVAFKEDHHPENCSIHSRGKEWSWRWIPCGGGLQVSSSERAALCPSLARLSSRTSFFTSPCRPACLSFSSYACCFVASLSRKHGWVSVVLRSYWSAAGRE